MFFGLVFIKTKCVELVLLLTFVSSNNLVFLTSRVRVLCQASVCMFNPFNNNRLQFQVTSKQLQAVPFSVSISLGLRKSAVIVTLGCRICPEDGSVLCPYIFVSQVHNFKLVYFGRTKKMEDCLLWCVYPHTHICTHTQRL